MMMTRKYSAYFEKHGTKCDAVETVQMLLGIGPDEAIQKITEDMGISLKAKPEAIVFDRNPDGYDSPEEWDNEVHDKLAEKAVNKHILISRGHIDRKDAQAISSDNQKEDSDECSVSS
jgi:hypothetical protein